MTTEKVLGHFLTGLLKLLKLKKNSITALQLLKFLILKKDTITCLRLLKFLALKKDFITSWRLLKVLYLKNDSIIFLWLLKFFKVAILQNAGEQSLLKVAYHIIFMINELYLLWVLSFIALEIYYLFGTKFSWKEETDTCFNVECVLLGCKFDFLGGYLVATARYLIITTGYCLLPDGDYSLLVVTARYHSLLLVSTFSMNAIFRFIRDPRVR